MPAQTVQGKAVYYTEFDTAPPLQACLRDGAGNPIDLTGCEVDISIAFTLPRSSYYTAPRDVIVPYAPVDIDPDQINNTGWVSWSPGTDEGVDALTPPGQFLYQFRITYQDGSIQTIPANTYLPLVIKAKVGGRSQNP